MEEQKNAALISGSRPTYEFDPSKPGIVAKNGVDTEIKTLSESERITIGEELLRQISERTGTPVSELRKIVAGIASGQVSSGNVKVDADRDAVFLAKKPIVASRFVRMLSEEGTPALVHQGQNRNGRRSASTLKRRAAAQSRR